MGRDVIIEIHGTNARLIDRVQSESINTISEACSYEVEGAEHMRRNSRYRKWDGMKRLFHSGTRRFMSGLIPRVSRILKGQGFDVRYVTKTPVAPVVDQIDGHFHHFDVRAYQEKAVDIFTLRKIGMLRVATGGGKTLIAAKCIDSLKMTTVFLVHTKDLLYQAKGVFSSIFGSNAVGQIGDGVVKPSHVTVATIQSLSRALNIKYESGDEDVRWTDPDTDVDSVSEFVQSIGFVIMDECHRVAAPTALDLVSSFKNANAVLGLSASPWRDDGADMALEAAFGPVFYQITASELVELKYLVPAVIRMLEVPFMEALPTRYDQIYREYVVDNRVRNQMGVDAAISSFRSGRCVMVLVRQIRHGNTLQKMLSEELGVWVPFISGSSSTVERQDTIDKVRDGRLRIFIASTIADEGLDLPTLDTVVLMGSGKSSVKALQRVGRVLRPSEGKDHAEVIDFNDNAKYLVQHSTRRLKLYQTEPEWVITDV